MAENRERDRWLRVRAEGWKLGSARWVSGLTLYLTLSGLGIYALPFSVFQQHSVLLHTLIGLLYLVPLAVYSRRHLADYWGYPLTHVKLSGWLLGGFLLVCVVSGVVLTYDAALGTRISYLWRTVHVVTTFGLVVFLLGHFPPLLVRTRRRAEGEAEVAAAMRGHLGVASLLTVVGLGATGALSFAIRPVEFRNEFPPDYDFEVYGAERPFAPSLATTATGGAFDARSLAGSESCGTARCHEQIYREWLPSAHRYSSMDPGFQRIQEVMAQQNGPVSTRYCGGCHDPISLFSGTKNIGVEELSSLEGYQEGISCLACHAIQETDVAGNANYVIRQPQRYVWELREGAVSTFLADFTIRAYPDHHVESLSHRMFKAPEFCAACHKQFIDEEVNQVGWVQLQNQYDNWKASRWHHEDDPRRTIECRECHMPLVASSDPAAGDELDFNRSAEDGKHRSHRFLGANQYVPKLLDLPGADGHVALVERWLRGEIEIPEIADRWREGPAVPIELQVPSTARPGETLPIRVHLVNNKTGHDFPTGPLDIIQAWVEVVVTDEAGEVVYHTGSVDERHRIEPGSYMFKAEPVDRYGNLIDRHNLWEMVGVRFKRALFPGSEEIASFTFDCPGSVAEEPRRAPDQEEVTLEVPEDAVGTLHVVAKLNYRKFDQYLLDFAFGEDAGLTAPITEMSRAEADITVVRAGR